MMGCNTGFCEYFLMGRGVAKKLSDKRERLDALTTQDGNLGQLFDMFIYQL
jgi:hypothetical protein